MDKADSSSVSMWDERFRVEGYAYGVEPSLYLKSKAGILLPGMNALAAADGGGRNAVWMAEQGLDVTLVDLSAEGLWRARELAAARGLTLRFIHADLLSWAWPTNAYDLVATVYFHLPPTARRRVHERMSRALKRGGHLLLEGFHTKQMHYNSGGPRDPAMLFDESILRDDFQSLLIIELRVEEVWLAESRLHSGPAMLIRMHAQSA